jgi:hypothetical protein
MVYLVRNKELRLLVINCIAMRFTEKESLSYLKTEGYDITARTYHRIKKDIVESRFKRMNEISDTGFIDSHLQSLDTLLHCQKEMWTNYYQCKDPYKKVEILTQICNLQPFISEYTSQSRQVMQNKTINTWKETESIQ